MSNIFADIVDDHRIKIKKGIHEIYYKKDVVEGLKLVITLIGIVKIVLLIGGVAAAAIGSIISYVGNHPQAAARCAQMISNKSEEIEKLITSAGKKFNDGYNALTEKEKKHVRTIILLVAKQGISWEEMH